MAEKPKLPPSSEEEIAAFIARSRALLQRRWVDDVDTVWEAKAALTLALDALARRSPLPEGSAAQVPPPIASTAEAPAASEIAWLIERIAVKPMIHYFCFDILTQHGIAIKHWSWTTDNQKATRFGRRQDAELAWQCATHRSLDDVEIVAHMWCRPPSPEQEGASHTEEQGKSRHRDLQDMARALEDARNYVNAVVLNATGRKKRANYRGCLMRIDAALAKHRGEG